MWLFSEFGCGNKQLILYLKVLLLLPLYPVQYLPLPHFLQVVILFSETLVLRKCQHLIDLVIIVWCTYYVTKVLYCHMYWMQCFSSKVVLQLICRLVNSFLWSLKKVTYVLCSNEELICIIMLHLIARFVGTVDDFITKWILKGLEGSVLTTCNLCEVWIVLWHTVATVRCSLYVTKCVRQLQTKKFEMKDIVHGEVTISITFLHQSSANVASTYRNCYFTLMYDSVRNM